MDMEFRHGRNFSNSCLLPRRQQEKAACALSPVRGPQVLQCRGRLGGAGIVAQPWAVSPQGSWRVGPTELPHPCWSHTSSGIHFLLKHCRHSYSGKSIHSKSQKTFDLYPVNTRKQSICCQFNINANEALY